MQAGQQNFSILLCILALTDGYYFQTGGKLRLLSMTTMISFGILLLLSLSFCEQNVECGFVPHIVPPCNQPILLLAADSTVCFVDLHTYGLVSFYFIAHFLAYLTLKTKNVFSQCCLYRCFWLQLAWFCRELQSCQFAHIYA